MKWNMKWPACKWNGPGKQWNEIWNGKLENEMIYEMALARNEIKYEMTS